MKTKRKPVEKSAPKKQRLIAGSRKARLDPGRAPGGIIWTDALDTLLNTNFSTVDDAVEAIIAEVAKREPAAGSALGKQFLRDLFETDPEFKAELVSLLSIKNKGI